MAAGAGQRSGHTGSSWHSDKLLWVQCKQQYCPLKTLRASFIGSRSTKQFNQGISVVEVYFLQQWGSRYLKGFPSIIREYSTPCSAQWQLQPRSRCVDTARGPVWMPQVWTQTPLMVLTAHASHMGPRVTHAAQSIPSAGPCSPALTESQKVRKKGLTSSQRSPRYSTDRKYK